MVKKRIMENYPSQATGILLDEKTKWLAISSQILVKSNMKGNSLITSLLSEGLRQVSLILDKKEESSVVN